MHALVVLTALCFATPESGHLRGADVDADDDGGILQVENDFENGDDNNIPTTEKSDGANFDDDDFSTKVGDLGYEDDSFDDDGFSSLNETAAESVWDHLFEQVC